MIIILMSLISRIFIRKYSYVLEISGYFYFRVMNIILFPTMIISMLVFQLVYEGHISKMSLAMIIHIAYFLGLICYYFLQTRALIYCTFRPSNNVFLITTSIENKFELPARFYQIMLALRKLVFAILIVYGKNINQAITFSLLLLCQLIWLAY